MDYIQNFVQAIVQLVSAGAGIIGQICQAIVQALGPAGTAVTGAVAGGAIAFGAATSGQPLAPGQTATPPAITAPAAPGPTPAGTPGLPGTPAQPGAVPVGTPAAPVAPGVLTGPNADATTIQQFAAQRVRDGLPLANAVPAQDDDAGSAN